MVIGVLAYLTRPDGPELWLAVAGLVIATSVLIVLAYVTRPPRSDVTDPVTRFGPEPPAVVSLLTNGFVVTPHAVTATLVDLAARRWLRIDPIDDDVAVFPDRQAPADDALTRYDQQVLNHIHRLTTGGTVGVSGTGVAVAGSRLAGTWQRRFTSAVVSEARRRGLTRRRWNLVVLAVAGLALGAAGWAWWTANTTGDEVAVADSIVPRAASIGVAVAIVATALVVLSLVRSQSQRATEEGRNQSRHWLGVRQAMVGRGYDTATSASLATTTANRRVLSYATALGLAETVLDELPVVPEDEHLAWSNATGRWRSVRIRYPLRPGYGRHPAVVLVVGLVFGFGLLALQRFLLDVSRRDALGSLYDDFPDQGDHIERAALVIAIVLIGGLLVCAWLVFAGAFDLMARLERNGLVVRARRPQRVRRPIDALRRLVRRDRYSMYLAVDDGRRDRVTAWLATERTAIPQGARAHVVATPVLGYVRRAESVGTVRDGADRARSVPIPVESPGPAIIHNAAHWPAPPASGDSEIEWQPFGDGPDRSGLLTPPGTATPHRSTATESNRTPASDPDATPT